MITLTEKIWKVICQVNRYWNWQIEPMSDREQYKKCEYWTFPYSGKGDCEDYAKAKKEDLEKRGIPSFFATCITPGGRGHVVLLVDTDRGTFVLDNRFSGVWHYQEVGYRWLKRELPGGKWYYIACQ